MRLQSPLSAGKSGLARIDATLLGVLLAVGLVGCTAFSPVPNPVEADAREYSRMYRAAIAVLRDEGFDLDRRDYRFGRITTNHLSSATMMEPWHRHNTTAYQAVESTLQDQRRRVRVFLDPIQPTGQEASANNSSSTPDYHLQVEVIVERREFPDRYLTGSTHGHGVFGTLASLPGELNHRGISQTEQWRPVGRDVYLEQRLLALIVRKSITLTPGPETKPPS